MPRSSSGRTCSASRGGAPPCPPLRPRARAGFSLLEVVIALAVVGLGVGVVFGGIAQGLRVRRQAAQDVALAVTAESVVGGLLARAAAPAEVEEGDDGDVHWRLEPLAEAAPRSGDTSRSPLVEVRISVEGAGGRSWEFATLLPREEAPAP